MLLNVAVAVAEVCLVFCGGGVMVLVSSMFLSETPNSMTPLNRELQSPNRELRTSIASLSLGPGPLILNSKL